ncbi:unnamed protein product [Phytophthora lilii]|uniref:Unnamed protein product n=1 Tax=Phytophthora lilii TaxID=2077276 RepID=A0A9W6XN40_9STRA|nr:unnamed protein product [Phytophthora lilii]
MTAFAQVHPSPQGETLGIDSANPNRGWVLLLTPLRAWKRLQVSYYGGKYSIERVLALETYTKTASLVRVLVVIMGTPVPMIALVVAQEIIPLQDPIEGWRANYGFWIRSLILAIVVGNTIFGQARYLIDGVDMSILRMILVSFSAASMFLICAATIAAYIIFPIPFFVLTLAPLFYVLLIISVRLIVGGKILHEMLAHSDQLIRYIIFVCAQVFVAIAYPCYESLFRAAEGSRYQMLVILLLPVLKVAVKNLLLRCTSHMEDMIPEAVIFTVDFFNAIYVATCMQRASSAVAITAITVTDLFQTCVMLYGLHHRTTALRLMLRQPSISIVHNDSMLAIVTSVCRDSDKYRDQFS